MEQAVCTKCGWSPTLTRDPEEKPVPKGKEWCPICKDLVKVRYEERQDLLQPEPTEPAEPTEPVEPTEPTEPAEPTEPEP